MARVVALVRSGIAGVLRLGIVGIALWAIFASPAAVPALDHVFPSAIQRGTTHSVTFVGKFDPWPPQIWMDGSGVRVEPTTNSGVFTVVAEPNAPVGPRFVRAFNGEGTSVPRFLIVAAEPQRAEVEPNNHRTSPQSLDPLPATVNGRLEKNGDVDSFSVRLEAGQTLVAWLEAYTLMSPLDPVLRLLDSRGTQVAWNHDDGRSLDPFLTWTATAPGTYLLQVFGFAYPADSDIRFSGNARAVYRLHVTSGPVVRHTVPLGIRRGFHTPLRLHGWNLGAGTNQDLVLDGTALDPAVAQIPLPPTVGESVLALPVGDGPEAVESEPNSTIAEANPLDVPAAVTGELARPGDEDRFVFTARKGERLVLEVQAATLGFPLDAWLAVEDRSSKELARNDDASGADPRLEWTPPEEGSYVATVGNLLQSGGEDQRYRLSVSRPQPSVKVTVPENAWSVAPGKTNEIKVTVQRRYGFDRKLSLSVTGLPDGIQCPPVEVADSSGEAILKLIAAPERKPFSGGIRMVATEADSGREHEVTMDLISAGENNGVPQGYRRLIRESIADFWLTVPPAPVPEKAADAK